MFRTTFCILLAVALIPLGVAQAADQKQSSDKASPHMQATVTGVNPEKNTITVKHSNKQGVTEEKTLQIGEDTKILDADGKTAKLKVFQSGDDICVTKQNDKVTELRKQAEAKITHVDAKAGTVTVQMTDKKGKDVEKTFQLIETTQYVDSLGNVAMVDIFKSGDQILYVEADGKVKTMKQSDKKSKNTSAEGKDKNAKAKNDKSKSKAKEQKPSDK